MKLNENKTNENFLRSKFKKGESSMKKEEIQKFIKVDQIIMI